MQPSARSRILILFSIILLAASAASAQKRPARQSAAAYDLSRETVLEGTVLSFTDSPVTPPMGARVTLQTASGSVDVHLGPASYLKANQFSLAPGDSVKIVGARVQQRQTSIFAARVIQKGNQMLAVRTANGMPLARAGIRGQLSSGRLPQAEGAR